MKKIYFTLIIAVFATVGFSQITIVSDDMPVGGDTYLISQTTILGFNGDDTGENYTWDFTDLMPLAQDTIAFVDIGNAPIIYQIVFNNPLDPDNQASEGEIKDVLGDFQGIELQDAFLFTNNTNSKKEEVGFGATINSIPIPVAFENNKLLYNFPLDFDDSGFDDFNFALEVPNTAYIGQSGNLNYDVDGWGTLITSFGTFDVLRVKRIINQYDTIFVTSSGFGFGINREITEYEWLGKNTGISLLKITTEFGIVTSANYQDNLLIPVGINEIDSPISSFSIYPQPARGVFHIGFDQFPHSPIHVNIYDLSGKKIWSKIYQPTEKISIDDAFNKGIYLVDIKSGDFQKVKKLIIQ
jgi:hypothetical protein